MKLKHDAVNSLEVFIAAIISILTTGVAYFLSFFSSATALFSLLTILSFLLLSYLYVTNQPRSSGRSKRNHQLLIHSLFATTIVFFVVLLATCGPALPGIASDYFAFLINVAEFFVLLLPVFFFSFIGVELFRSGGDRRKAALVLFALALLILILYYSSHFLLKSFSLNDEEFLAFESVNQTLRGINPYTVSVAQGIFNNVNQVGASVTTSNRIIGVMDYPALFFLSFIPFYLASQPTLYNLGHFDLPLQASVFLFILVLALAFSLDRQNRVKPRLMLLTFFVIGTTLIVSVTTFLMLAFLLLAYSKIDSKYAWIPIGLCLSLQEELWIPALLLILYSFNNHGMRRGAYNALGAIGVFLLFNSYFIATAPAAFFQAVFTPLSKLYIPNGASPAGFFLLQNYPLLLPTFSQLFEISVVIAVLLFVYANRKELIPLLSLLPFIMWQHALGAYYAFFLFFFIFALSIKKEKAENGILQRFLRKRKTVLYAALTLFLALAVYVSYTSHAAYTKNFSITSSNESLALNFANRTSIYTAQINYRGLENNTVFLYALAYGNLTSVEIGFFNDNFLGSKPACDNYTCKVNLNVIHLPANQTKYAVRAVIPWSNAIRPLNYIVMNIYNGEYFYISPSVYNASA